MLHKLSRSVLGPGVSCTALTDSALHAHFQKIQPGGMLVMGERVESPQLTEEEIAKHEKVRLHLDVTAAHPYQLLQWKLPQLEHATTVQDFSSSLDEGLEYIRKADLHGDLVETVEIWGHFPAELHAKLSPVPPTWGRISLKGTDLSRFQRIFFGAHTDKILKDRVVGHLFPLCGAVEFMRLVKIFLRLGFVFTRIGKVTSTPASFWARPFAERQQQRRREAALKGPSERATVDSVKRTCNSLIGSLNMDASKYTTVAVHKTWKKKSPSSMTTAEVYAEHPRSTLRSFQVADLELYQLERKKVLMNQQMLAALFVPAMTRADLLELWYGDSVDTAPPDRHRCDGTYHDWLPQSAGICALPGAKVLYGATDSLYIELSIPQNTLFKFLAKGDFVPLSDARHVLAAHLGCRLDLSNVPPDSSFYKHMPDWLLSTIKERNANGWNRDKWGCLREETGMAGIEGMLVNGANHYAVAIVQNDDTLVKHRGPQNGDVYKGMLKLLKDCEEPPTMAEYWASWLGKASPKKTVEAASAHGGAHTVERTVAPYCQLSCIVSRSDGFPHYPFGSQAPDAVKCREGTAW